MKSQNTLTAKACFDQGNEYKRASNFTAALDAFRRSIKLNPRVAAPWLGLAQLLALNSQFEDARSCLQRAVLADTGSLSARIQLAAAHKNLGYVEDAKREYTQALALNPQSAVAYLGMGQLFEDIGCPEDAGAAYRQALSLDASKKDALACLLGLGRYLDISAEINEAQNSLRSLPLRETALIGYGLGKAYEQRKNYQAAFAAYEIANAARREVEGPFNRKAFAARIDKLIDVFSADFFKARQGWGKPSARPVFIVGLPRSGTTLTEQIISSHPACFGAGELSTLADLATGTPDRLQQAERSWPHCAPKLNKAQISILGQDYLDQSCLRAPTDSLRIVDKQPLNFWNLGLVALALPNARIIHCKRDIRDCGFSIFSHNFNVQQNWSTDLEDIAYYWRGYQRLMRHWRSVTNLQFLDQCYEDTVSDLTTHAQKLLSFIDLPWDDQVLEFHHNERAVQTPSRWQVRQPLYKTSLARWQNYDGKLGPLMKAADQINF